MPSLAVEYYQRFADGGHPDGANNIGFCPEHGRGVREDIGLASEYHKFAADQGDADAAVNYRRSLRLLGRWSIPDQSSDVALHPPSHADLSALSGCRD
jgi:TPR repeat protein